MGRDYFGTLKDPLEKNFSRKQPDNRVSPSLYGTDYQTVVCADTNVFNPAVLKQVKVGDKVTFEAEEAASGYTVTKVQKAK